MNEMHLQFLASPDWSRILESELLPWIEGAGDLGADGLEIGPGPGLTTDLLRQRVRRLTAVEIDPTLGEALRSRLAGSNVEVLVADATEPAHTFTPVDPEDLVERLSRVGFGATTIDVLGYHFRFLSRKP